MQDRKSDILQKLRAWECSVFWLNYLICKTLAACDICDKVMKMLIATSWIKNYTCFKFWFFFSDFFGKWGFLSQTTIFWQDQDFLKKFRTNFQQCKIEWVVSSFPFSWPWCYCGWETWINFFTQNAVALTQNWSSAAYLPDLCVKCLILSTYYVNIVWMCASDKQRDDNLCLLSTRCNNRNRLQNGFACHLFYFMSCNVLQLKCL